MMRYLSDIQKIILSIIQGFKQGKFQILWFLLIAIHRMNVQSNDQRYRVQLFSKIICMYIMKINFFKAKFIYPHLLSIFYVLQQNLASIRQGRS